MAIKPATAIAIGVAAAGIASLAFGKKPKPPTTVNWPGTTPDRRAKLLLPANSPYLLSSYTVGPNDEIFNAGGIVFPYTPLISFENAATYTPMQFVHSNYNYYSYKGSAVNQINLTAKFTVNNDSDAGMYLSIQHLLRVLVKMPFGGDQNAGSPPPILRLTAYGPYMLQNVPVVIGSFKTEFPDNVDYYQTASLNKTAANGGSYSQFGSTTNMVPTISTMAITLYPAYSRYEQASYSVDNWLNTGPNNTGYL